MGGVVVDRRWRQLLAVATAMFVAVESVSAQQQPDSSSISLQPIVVQAKKKKPPRRAAVTRRAAPTQPATAPLPAAPAETAYGPVRGYLAGRSATGIKTDTPLKEIPQSISVVTEDRMKD